jgi:tetratricopeptide (TPR) repeat protein
MQVGELIERGFFSIIKVMRLKKVLQILIILLISLTAFSEEKQKLTEIDFLLDLVSGYLNQGKIDEAEEILKRLNISFPDNYDIRLYKGIVLLIKKNYEAAYEELHKIENSLEA